MTITSPSWILHIDGKKVETIEMPYDYIKESMTFSIIIDLEEGLTNWLLNGLIQMKNMPFNVKTWWFIHPHRQSQSILINKREKP